jgi:hypothetical protein
MIVPNEMVSQIPIGALHRVPWLALDLSSMGLSWAVSSPSDLKTPIFSPLQGSPNELHAMRVRPRDSESRNANLKHLRDALSPKYINT